MGTIKAMLLVEQNGVGAVSRPRSSRLVACKSRSGDRSTGSCVAVAGVLTCFVGALSRARLRRVHYIRLIAPDRDLEIAPTMCDEAIQIAPIQIAAIQIAAIQIEAIQIAAIQIAAIQIAAIQMAAIQMAAIQMAAIQMAAVQIAAIQWQQFNSGNSIAAVQWQQFNSGNSMAAVQ